jgi:hypothetical protein
MKLEDHRIIFYTYQLLVLKPPNHGLVFRIVDQQSFSIPSPIGEYMTQIGKKKKKKKTKTIIEFTQEEH